MKDIVISARQIIRELLIFAGCILAAFVVNVYSIIQFKTEWKELITTLHITLALALVFFAVVVVLRATVFCCRRLLQKKAG